MLEKRWDDTTAVHANTLDIIGRRLISMQFRACHERQRDTCRRTQQSPIVALQRPSIDNTERAQANVAWALSMSVNDYGRREGDLGSLHLLRREPEFGHGIAGQKDLPQSIDRLDEIRIFSNPPSVTSWPMRKPWP